MVTVLQSQNEIRCRFDARVFEEPLQHSTEHFSITSTDENNDQFVTVVSHTADPAEGFCRAGCAIQHMEYTGIDLSGYPASKKPVVSCIILLTFNPSFTRYFLVPSLIRNTRADYEIIIVYNGVGADLSAFGSFKVVESDTGWVSKAYNAGVTAARGEYIAIFHDDCTVVQPGWDEVMMDTLTAGCFATSTELVYNPAFSFHFLKGTPLMMTRSNYQLMDGHDEWYFAGIEDLDFSYRIQAKGHTIRQTEIPYRHFNGMSTVILLNGQPETMRTLFGYCLLPPSVIEKWKIECMNAHRMQTLITEVNAENLKYFKSKVAAQTAGGLNNSPHPLDTNALQTFHTIRTNYRRWIDEIF